MTHYSPYGYVAQALWRRNAKLGRITAGLFVVNAALTAVTVWNTSRLRADFKEFNLNSEPDSWITGRFQRYSAISGVVSLFSIAGLILAIVLTWRLAKNHQAIGRPGTTFGPGWAIAGWLIPLASSILPFLLLTELWRGSNQDAPPHSPEWKKSPASNLIYAWFALQLVASIVGIVFLARTFAGLNFSTLGSSSDTPSLVEQLVDDSLSAVAATAVVGALANLLGALTLARLSARQDTYAHSFNLASSGGLSNAAAGQWAGTVGAGPTAAHAPEPGWHPDPAQRHQFRFWDGQRWTDAVADNGMVSQEPPF